MGISSKFLNANTDVNLGTADDQVPSQNAVKTYVDNKVGDGTITIQKNGIDVDSFTTNQSTSKSINIEVPTVNNNTITIQKNGTDVDSFTLNQNTDKSINITVPTTAADVNALPDSTKYGAGLDYTGSILTLQDQDGNNLDQVTITAGSSALSDLTDVTITSPSNNQVLKYDSTSQKWINGTGGGGSVEIDNLTITENSSNEIQTIATLNQNDTTKGLKTWSGTLTEYEAITTKDPDTIYYIQETPQQISVYQPPLLSSMWSDHILSDMNWLRADNFSWQSGSTYPLVYNHLVNDISGITASTETIGSYTVTYYRANDGHKVCLADQETTINNIYSSYGIAWYYILDTTNTQFKLPRTKYGFEGLRDSVGNIIPESLPNIKGILGFIEGSDNMTRTGPFYKSESVYGVVGSAWATSNGQGFDASRASSTYQNNAPVQERATQMYLYFYVGGFTTSAIQQTAGLNAELFNSKMDFDLGNLPAAQTVLTKTDASNLNTTGKAFISGLGMPSTKYTALSLGASGSTYTAPANGWFTLNKTSGGSGRMIQLNNQTRGPLVVGASAGSSGYGIPVIMPALAGDIVKVEYDATGSTNYFGFLYAEGDQD